MIARPLPYREDSRTRVGTRSGRTAARLRRGRTNRQRYAALGRVSSVLAAFTFCIVVYLGLMANVTRMNYDLGKNAREKARLLDVSANLSDRISRLESRERLAQIAKRLGMREPLTFAEIDLPVDRPPTPTGLAFLPWLK